MLRFFSDERTHEALESISASPRVTIFAGAGTSAEAGLPLWGALVEKLTRDAMQTCYPEQSRAALAEEAESLDLLAQAELAHALFDDLAGQQAFSLKDAIFEALYGDDTPEDLVPGHLATAIAQFKTSRGPQAQIATTNYDVLLETALRANGVAARHIKSYISGYEPKDTDSAVTHLHGILSTKRRDGVVLTEGDYHRMQRRQSWQERYTLEALMGSTCLFVGASMTDSNLIRYLHGAANTDREHFAFFVRSSPSPDVPASRLAWEDALSKRWAKLGVTALFPDHYADIGAVPQRDSAPARQ